MWSHLHQWEGGEPPAEGQNWDPDTEGEAQHGQSQNFMWRKICRVLCAENINVIKSLVYCTSGGFFSFYFPGRCQCGCNSRFLKLRMGTISEWLSRLVNNRMWSLSLGWNLSSCILNLPSCPPGESVWAADQHTHQDRRIPDSDFKVRACTDVARKTDLTLLHQKYLAEKTTKPAALSTIRISTITEKSIHINSNSGFQRVSSIFI